MTSAAPANAPDASGSSDSSAAVNAPDAVGGMDAPATVAPVVAIVGGNPSAAEVAAVTAVVTAAIDELASAGDDGPEPQPSAWSRSQRGIRTPMHPGAGAWRGFTA
ncbi:acyl-CoA carboxylase epsilon subunit-like protein [Homoserinimonas aerilata]|uniref:Acyl-CoA carboxylase epsilon subunit-like protein n=1 Tax=Homoserinimonas aerilata TaxID=1162970 RepID=A0A542YL68_9MICO|nr:acyl-CoA carboxylase epsilon subunit [Homoserinimonas aerilata]TQL48674.1 acyl-CoA carboxylase epsilon subunit-like protein [Homoserinimonas aerilata]